MGQSLGARRLAAAAAVIIVHALIGLMLYASFPSRATPPPGDALQLLKVELINRPPPTPEPDPEPHDSPPPTRSPAAESPSAFIASGAGGRIPPTEMAATVTDAEYFDSRPLSLACGRAYPDSAPDLGIPGTVTLLVRVEPSGRPSELKVVASSGAPSLDEAASGCLMALGALRPTYVGGRAVSGWQRVVWRSIAGAR
jgi:TonB family protein